MPLASCLYTISQNISREGYDLLLNTDAIKQSRNQRGWTQQHLADACDVSLRTIQRVEKTGAASNETTAALAAVFELQQKTLKIIPEVIADELQPVNLFRRNLGLLVATLFGAIVGGLIMYFIIQ